MVIQEPSRERAPSSSPQPSWYRRILASSVERATPSSRAAFRLFPRVNRSIAAMCRASAASSDSGVGMAAASVTTKWAPASTPGGMGRLSSCTTT